MSRAKRKPCDRFTLIFDYGDQKRRLRLARLIAYRFRGLHLSYAVESNLAPHH